MTLKYLLEKEFKQIIRNPFLPRMILMFPLMVLLVFPRAANFEIKNINLCVVDNDHSSYSQRLVQKITSSGYFRLVEVSPTYQQAIKTIEEDKSDIILEIPNKFERDLIREQGAKVMISSNTVNGTKGGMGYFYLSSIIGNFSSDVQQEWIQTDKISSIPIIETVNQNRFNTHLDYKVFMVPALMVMILTMVCGFMPALNIVGEKEAGTMEQINVTPVSKFMFIFSKLLPYWIIGFTILTFSFIIAFLVYNLSPAGHIATIYLFASIYILAVSGLGLVISNYSDTMQQALFVMYFFMMILIIMSGLFTPISSMPQWAQYTTNFNPLRYFMEVMRMVYLKGSGIKELITQLCALLGFALFFNTWAVVSYKKKN
jgi:ABC-2 type transport system permease protein